jgi:peptidoglycan/xylan/chitin deacetylase (PgdA/CDA1 family)
MNPKTGKLVISLDFELYWGMFDKVSLAEYGPHLTGEHEVIPLILNTFSEFGLHATWATVGMLTFDNKAMLMHALPDQKPAYIDQGLSSYQHLQTGAVGDDEKHDPYHFAPDLVRLIQAHPHQEIASHTFSHYYTLEPGQTKEQFLADLEAEREALSRFGIEPRSIVFPRNQVNPEYLELCRQVGIVAYRGTESHPWYVSRPGNEQSLTVRAKRLIDAYVNLSGMHTYPLKSVTGSMHNIPASRFLRPYSGRLSVFESLRVRRIVQAMEHAALHNEIFHLWWHPHNFGTNIQSNMHVLRTIAEAYRVLAQSHQFESVTMGELSALVPVTTSA